MDWTIAFDKTHRIISEDGKSAYSDFIYVPVGETALLSLYNMFNGLAVKTDPTTGKSSLIADNCATIHKVSLGPTGDVARELECGERVNILGELKTLLYERRVFHEPVYQCGEKWVLNPCNNYALIPVPGLYLIELFDVNQFDTAYIEYTLLSVADSMAIPDDFKLGSSLK